MPTGLINYYTIIYAEDEYNALTHWVCEFFFGEASLCLPWPYYGDEWRVSLVTVEH